MSGKPKIGLNYAGWSVDMFDGDKKIDKLLDAQGWKGFGLYFFLCQRAYKTGGYYYEWGYDDSATTARKMGGGVTSQTVEETVKFCLQIGLFEKALFDRWSILTSRGIQRRFWEVAKGRRATPIIDEKLWLLPPEEACGLDMCAQFEDLSLADEHLQPTDGHLQPTDGPKVKEREGKESKGKKREIERESAASPESGKDAEPETASAQSEKTGQQGKPVKRKRFVPPTLEEVREYCKSRNSTVKPEQFFDYFNTGNWVDSKGNPVKNWKQKIITWEKFNGGNGGGSNGGGRRQSAKTQYGGKDFFDDD